MMIDRIKRVIELWRCMGWDYRLFKKTLFPPFPGWDIGCGYCYLERRALKAGRCRRSEDVKHKGGCGV